MDQYPSIENMPEPQIVESLDQRNPLRKDRSQFSVLENLLRRFSPSERLALYFFSIILGLGVAILLLEINYSISVEVPARGGQYTEGETGTARFINPVLAISQADLDLSSLIYSGLIRVLPNGSYIPDLADHYTISSDGNIYTFTLRRNATFHDGTAVTAADVLFTVAAAQNPDMKSPHRADWEGVVATSPEPYTVVFKLPHAYSPFIENTTLGILPKHLWQKVTPESFPFSTLNTHPVGSGPYKISNTKTDSTGTPTRYDLIPFESFTLGTPYISTFSFVFFPTQDALVKAYNMHQIDAVAGVTPSDLSQFRRSDVSGVAVPLPRVFGLFFNQSHNAVLADASVRLALETSINKKRIVNSALSGYGEVIDTTIPPGIMGTPAPATPVSYSAMRANAKALNSTATSTDPVASARSILQKGGWSMASSTKGWNKNKDTISIKLATADEPELVATANAVAENWRAAGIIVDVQIFPLSDFNNTVLRPRNYDVILFGEVVSRSGDLFAFWHSSQRNDPGLNLSLYANSKADALLSKARASTQKQDRDSLYQQFASVLQNDRPAIFLYSPDFIYIVPKGIQDIQIGALTTPSERFLNAYQWYSEKQRVWYFFARSH